MCRGQAILLASILKVKGIPTRVRSGFAEYLSHDGIYYDHWITEYYSEKEKRWILVDVDAQWGDEKIDFDLNDLPREKFMFSAQAYRNLRQKNLDGEKLVYESNPATVGLFAAIRVLFLDFYCLMNNEVPYDFIPQYVQGKIFIDEKLSELDELANLMLDPDKNFDELQKLYYLSTLRPKKFERIEGNEL